MRYFFLLFGLLFSITVLSQELTGSQLLDKAIEYHDPKNQWPTFQGKLSITMTTPDQTQRISDITIKLPEEYFQVRSAKDEVIIEQTVNKGECMLKLNGSIEISDDDKKTHRLTCERATMYKNYYTYLYGLPMKLKDPGTIIAPTTQKKIFKGKEYLVLKVTYEKEVGGDIWYFYFCHGDIPVFQR